MAKALLGHLGPDPRAVSRMTSENRRLRQRVADLEAHVVRLQAQHDRLEAEAAHVRDRAESMQPA